MKKWSIPAKTFLVGEYAALLGHEAIVLTTTPCFELSLVATPGLTGIHPESPAGKFWQQHGDKQHGLQWFDPYNAIGGLGASSAQFLGAYRAVAHLQNKPLSQQEMLDLYWEYAWHGQGIRPSGYDLLAQSLSGVIHIDGNLLQSQRLHWPFSDIDFILLHTGKKLATHQHLQTETLSKEFERLSSIVDKAAQAFMNSDSATLIQVVNAYHQNLSQLQLVAEHSLQEIFTLQKQEEILAVKGCGALGADIILLIVATKDSTKICERLQSDRKKVIATSNDLYF